ncbi:MAG: SurA N-terminal domain-containing protein [Chthoniobacterales bacterium]
MFTTIRKHQRWLMLLIAALTIIAFAFLYNTTEMDRVGSNMVAKIYGHNVMQVDIEKAVRNTSWPLRSANSSWCATWPAKPKARTRRRAISSGT